MVLKLENITKNYGKKTALDKVCLELEKGVYALLGPNGAGKTTLINIIVGLLEPNYGTITYNGVNIYDKSVKYISKLGYLPQYPKFYKNFSAYEFLSYMAVMKGINKKDIPKLVPKLLEQVNLSDEAKRKIGQFSGGMRQRLGIAQAILNEPEILILDEPTAGLDPKERIRFRNIISRLSENRIVILATHIVSDVEYIAKEVILIKNGVIVETASPRELTENLDGKVWTFNCSPDELDRWINNFNISNANIHDNNYLLRIVSDDKPEENAEKVIPNLEDVYLYYFGETNDKI